MSEVFNITQFLLTMSLMLFTAKLFGEIFIKFRQPAVVGEILAGIILGPTILGRFYPDLFNSLFRDGSVKTALDGITILAVVLLLLVSGLEVDLNVVFRQGKKTFYTSILGIIIPFILGFAAVYLLPGIFVNESGQSNFLFASFLGTAMAISALPVIAKSLMDLGIFRTDIGLIVISAAMFDDITGWLIFSLILGNMGGGVHHFSFLVTFGLTILFVLISAFVIRRIFNKLIPLLQSKISYPGGMLNFIFIMALLGAALTEYIGIHAIFGAFIMGIAIGNSPEFREELRDNIHQFVTNLFAPLFFVSIGLRVNFGEYFNLPLVIIILIIAFAGKVIGCSTGAYLGGLSKSDSLAVGFGMNSRGAMEIILGIIALESGLIGEELFVALVIMAVVTSLTGAPLMNYYIHKKKVTFLNILKPELVFFTDYKTKDEVINFLISSAALHYKLDNSEILKDVMEREDSSSTGIANYLALPHGRIKSGKPVAAAAINKSGINFDSADSTPSRIIILLLTPRNNNELQLKLLAEVAGKFRQKEQAEKYLSASDAREFIHLLST